MGDTININNVQGNVLGGKVEGAGNIIGLNVTISGNISVNSTVQDNELIDGIRAFAEIVDRQLHEHNAKPEQAALIQTHINELTKEVEGVVGLDKIPYSKKTIIQSKLAALAEGMWKVLPAAAEIASSFTPLAPFGKLIGTSVDKIVQAVREA